MVRAKKDALVEIVKDILRQLQSLDDADFEDLFSGKARLQLSVASRKISAAENPSASARIEDFGKIVEQLRTLATREEGERLLSEKSVTRGSLTGLARLLDLPIKKSEGMEQLRNRIVEATIGFRLRSAAIQGGNDIKRQTPGQTADTSDQPKSD